MAFKKTVFLTCSDTLKQTEDRAHLSCPGGRVEGDDEVHLAGAWVGEAELHTCLCQRIYHQSRRELSRSSARG